LRLIRVLVLSLVAAACIRAGTAAAQTWPTGRPTTMVVPFPPGPALDLVARLVAGKLGETLGQTIVVENRSGANGTIGSNLVARAAPDGFTLLAATAGTHVTAVHLMKSLPYDPSRTSPRSRRRSSR
jgi:tripartite-type tricarboxylate transporter receptor subunit TctC